MGTCKKIIIADTCAFYVDIIFGEYQTQSGINLVWGAVLFAFQIYGDFSGYSDIAIGTAKLLGFNLMINFRTPYFSRDIAEFWRRWHISLSTWFRDYLYIPLGGSRGTKWMSLRNIIIIFVVSGFWHGANWTFIVWGALNALYFVPLFLLNKNRSNLDVVAKGKLLPSLREVYQMFITFALTCLAWIFFRAESVGHAIAYIKGIFTKSLFELPDYWHLLPLLLLFLIIEWIYREVDYQFDIIAIPKPVRWVTYYFLIAIILSTR